MASLPFLFGYREGAQATSTARPLSTGNVAGAVDFADAGAARGRAPLDAADFTLPAGDHNPATSRPNSRPNRARQ
jgi:hypothetical protein